MNIFKAFTKIEDGIMKEEKNRKEFLLKHDLFNKKDIVMYQVHGNSIAHVNEDYSLAHVDALITNRGDVALFARVADCLPILFYDSDVNVIAVAHEGRKGTFADIVSCVIDSFKNDYSSEAKNIKVAIGPSIQHCCYEVSQEMVDFVLNNFGKRFIYEKNIDLQGITKKQLLDSGTLEDNIEISKVCTKCSGSEYYSFRRDGLFRHNFAGVISMV